MYIVDTEFHSIKVSSRFSRLKSKCLRDIVHIPLQASQTIPPIINTETRQ